MPPMSGVAPIPEPACNAGAATQARRSEARRETTKSSRRVKASSPGRLTDHVERLHDLREVTGAGMSLAAIDQQGLFLGADRLSLPATRAEAATGGRIRRARHIPLEHDPLAFAALARLLDRDSRKQRLRVGMRRLLVDLVPRPDL